MNDFKDQFLISKTKGRLLHDIWFWNIEAYRVPRPNIAATWIQNVSHVAYTLLSFCFELSRLCCVILSKNKVNNAPKLT